MSANKAGTNSAARTKSADLERIRNNQRRCRARRREYITELEDKVRQYESANSRSSANPELQRLVRENESLKRLLKSLGLGDDFLKAYGKANQNAAKIFQAQLGNESCCQTKGCFTSSPPLDRVQADLITTMTWGLQAQDASMLLDIDTETSTQSSSHTFESSSQADAVLPWEPFDFPTISTSDLAFLPTEIQLQSPVQATGDSLMTALSSTMPEEDMSDTTTLCSLAFSLVRKNNLKGYSVADLNLKLRAGYRHGGTPSEGCRVDNKVLFTVLAEIS